MASKPKQSSERGRHAADEVPARGASRMGNGAPLKNRPSSAARAGDDESDYPPPARKSRPDSNAPASGGDQLSAKDSKKGALEKLVEAGKNKGFLTYDEVNDALPPEMVTSEQIDDLMVWLGNDGAL